MASRAGIKTMVYPSLNASPGCDWDMDMVAVDNIFELLRATVTCKYLILFARFLLSDVLS